MNKLSQQRISAGACALIAVIISCLPINSAQAAGKLRTCCRWDPTRPLTCLFYCPSDSVNAGSLKAQPANSQPKGRTGVTQPVSGGSKAR
jgi:hypothetical protein